MGTIWSLKIEKSFFKKTLWIAYLSGISRYKLMGYAVFQIADKGADKPRTGGGQGVDKTLQISVLKPRERLMIVGRNVNWGVAEARPLSVMDEAKNRGFGLVLNTKVAKKKPGRCGPARF